MYNSTMILRKTEQMLNAGGGERSQRIKQKAKKISMQIF